MRVVEVEDEHAEARYVAAGIAGLVEEGVNGDEIAVFYRTNAQSRVLEDILVRQGVAYVVLGGPRFYERAEVKDVVAYLQAIDNPYDAVSLARIANRPRRAIGDTTLARLQSHADALGISLWEAMADPEAAGCASAATKAVTGFKTLMDSLQAGALELEVPELVERVLERSGYVEALEAERTIEAAGRIENVQELVSVAQEWQHEAAEPTLSSFLQEISLYSDQDALRGEGNLVTLMTLHNAKGLEFRAVYVIGMEEGVFPHSRSIEEQGIEEERRLAYVAMTRAMERLTLMHASVADAVGLARLQPALALPRRAAGGARRARPAAAVVVGGLRRPEAVRGRAARRRARPRDRRQRPARDARRGRRHPGRARRRRHRPLRRRVHRPPAHDRLRALGEDRLSVEIRTCRDLDEFREALGGIGHYFGWIPDAEASERFSRNLALERMHTIRLDGELAGGGGVFPFELTVPGGRVRAGGVTVIGILPPYRRRGLLSALDADAARRHARARRARRLPLGVRGSRSTAASATAWRR